MNIAGAFNEFSNPAGMWDLLVKNNYYIYGKNVHSLIKRIWVIELDNLP